jgi:proteasome activator subunit 4
MCLVLIESKKRLDRKDLVLDWRPIYKVLGWECFPKRRKFQHTNVGSGLLFLCEGLGRFWDNGDESFRELLETVLPDLNGSSLNSVLTTQSFLIHLIPNLRVHQIDILLPTIFKLWESFNSRIFDEQWLDLISKFIERIFRGEDWNRDVAEGVKPVNWESSRGDQGEGSDEWEELVKLCTNESKTDISGKKKGKESDFKKLKKDIGIFKEDQWGALMTKCLRFMGVPVGSSKVSPSPLIINPTPSQHIALKHQLRTVPSRPSQTHPTPTLA